MFKCVACFDPKTLHLKHEIPTPQVNFRVTSIPAEDGREEELVAVGEFHNGPDWDSSEVLLLSPREVDSPFRKLSVSHSSDVLLGLCYFPPRLIVSGGQKGHDLVVSDVSIGEKVMDLKDPPEGIARIVTASSTQQHGAPRRGDGFIFVGGGDRIASGADQSIRHYDLGRSERANEVVQKFEGHEYWAYGLGYSTEKNLLFSSSLDKTLRIWSVQDGTSLHTFELSSFSTSLLFDPKKRLIFCGVVGGIIEVWDVRQTKKRVRKFNHPTKNFVAIRDLTQIGDGKYASVGEDASVATWTDRGKILATAKTRHMNFGMCYVGSASPDVSRSDDDDRLAFLLKTCCNPPTESARVAGFFVAKALLCVQPQAPRTEPLINSMPAIYDAIVNGRARPGDCWTVESGFVEEEAADLEHVEEVVYLTLEELDDVASPLESWDPWSL